MRIKTESGAVEVLSPLDPASYRATRLALLEQRNARLMRLIALHQHHTQQQQAELAKLRAIAGAAYALAIMPGDHDQQFDSLESALFDLYGLPLTVAA